MIKKFLFLAKRIFFYTIHIPKTIKTIIIDINKKIQYPESIDRKNILFWESDYNYNRNTNALPNISTILRNNKQEEIEIFHEQNQRAFKLINQSFESALSKDIKPIPLTEGQRRLLW